jgi:predicted RNase H-like nuclease
VIAGVDASRGGWVAVALEAGRVSGTFFLDAVDTDFHDLQAAEVIAVDIPIGFGPRRADQEARRFIGGRAAAAVFTVPTRELLEQPFTPGVHVSAQAHALGPRIIHVTDLATTDDRFREIHPEVSFCAMNDGRPLAARKKTYGGVIERIELLRRQGIELRQVDERVSSRPIHDVLDAAAAAWSAQRIAAGSAGSLPDPPERVDDRDVAIWY